MNLETARVRPKGLHQKIRKLRVSLVGATKSSFGGPQSRTRLRISPGHDTQLLEDPHGISREKAAASKHITRTVASKSSRRPLIVGRSPPGWMPPPWHNGRACTRESFMSKASETVPEEFRASHSLLSETQSGNVLGTWNGLANCPLDRRSRRQRNIGSRRYSCRQPSGHCAGVISLSTRRIRCPSGESRRYRRGGG